MKETKARATELEFFQWFYRNTDFGPADSDVRDILKQQFMDKTGKLIPKGYNTFSDGETSTDV